MIKITVELVSANGRERDRLLGVGLIHNVGGDAQHGNYSVWLSKMAPKERQAWKTGDVVLSPEELYDGLTADIEQFDRDKRGCWDLLFQALRKIVGSRNPTAIAIAQDVVPIPPQRSRLRTPKV